MKQKMSLFIISCLLIGMLSGCGAKKEEKIVMQPEIEQIHSICQLATMECYYHNVAISTKSKGTGIEHLGEKEREFWIEYTGVARIGIDMSKVEMAIQDNVVSIYVPDAELFSIEVKQDSLTEDSYVASEDGFFNKNEITAENQTQAIADAQAKMEESVLANDSLFVSAKDRAKKLIENYVTQLGVACGVEYQVVWTKEPVL